MSRVNDNRDNETLHERERFLEMRVATMKSKIIEFQDTIASQIILIQKLETELESYREEKQHSIFL